MAAVFTIPTQHNGERYMNALVYSFGSYHASDQVDQLFAHIDTASEPLNTMILFRRLILNNLSLL